MDYHDVLAEVGAGGAHPGGQDATRLWMNAIPWTSSLRVLDVGCGTGRTLLEIGRQYGCRLTGVDVRPAMIKKARKRSALMRQQAEWKVASAEHLPFPNESFDVVYTESVNVFVNAARAIGEYARVLAPDGWYIDVEMMLLGPVSDTWKASAQAVYGAQTVPDLGGWKKLYASAGFNQIRVLLTKSVRPEDNLQLDQATADPIDLVSPGAYQNPRVLAVLRKNAEWMEKNHKPLGYGVFLCRKRPEG